VRGVMATIGGGGALSVLAAIGWPGIVLAVAVVVLIVLGCCWVLSDGDRTRRLVMVIGAMRGDGRGKGGQGGRA